MWQAEPDQHCGCKLWQQIDSRKTSELTALHLNAGSGRKNGFSDPRHNIGCTLATQRMLAYDSASGEILIASAKSKRFTDGNLPDESTPEIQDPNLL